MKMIRIVSRYFVGLVFLFSGFVKAVDPLGYAYKISDYFDAFGMPFLKITAVTLAIALSSLELIIGFNLVLGIRKKITAWVLMVLMAYFTILTFILALTNPVSDCGCFGDAVILTNWQTFWKNIILLVPTCIVFFQFYKARQYFSSINEWILSSTFTLVILIFSILCLQRLPFFDFRPYHVGANIKEGMKIPEGAPQDEYRITYIYEKNGVQQEFDVDNIPWQDSTWKYVDRIDELVSKGYEPPIHDFTITSEDGFDYTQQVLEDTNYIGLIVAPKLPFEKYKYYDEIKDFVSNLPDSNVTVYALTAETYNEIELFKNTVKPNFELYSADEITLKTIIRANPGVLLIKDATILGKWYTKSLPDAQALITIPPKQLVNKFLVIKKMKLTSILSLLIVFFVISVIITYKKEKE